MIPTTIMITPTALLKWWGSTARQTPAPTAMITIRVMAMITAMPAIRMNTMPT